MTDALGALDHIAVMDALQYFKSLPDEIAQMGMTSPPYFNLRDYKADGQIGMERTVDEYIGRLVDIFREIRRVLKPSGTFYVNIGDSYAGSGRGSGNNYYSHIGHQATRQGFVKAPHIYRDLPPKSMIGIPWRLAFAMEVDGWILQDDFIWYKPNSKPESVRDRPTNTTEHIFMFSKEQDYFCDRDYIPGRIWKIGTQLYKQGHFAMYPERLVRPAILASSNAGDIVVDPFMGGGTTAVVAKREGRHYIGSELNTSYAAIADERIFSTPRRLL